MKWGGFTLLTKVWIFFNRLVPSQILDDQNLEYFISYMYAVS